jgi:hypothetical protein
MVSLPEAIASKQETKKTGSEKQMMVLGSDPGLDI